MLSTTHSKREQDQERRNPSPARCSSRPLSFLHQLSSPSPPTQARCITLRPRRRCPTSTMCRGAMRRRDASTHASSRRCAASAATRPASAASTASAAAATRPPRRPDGDGDRLRLFT